MLFGLRISFFKLLLGAGFRDPPAGGEAVLRPLHIIMIRTSPSPPSLSFRTDRHSGFISSMSFIFLEINLNYSCSIFFLPYKERWFVFKEVFHLRGSED